MLANKLLSACGSLDEPLWVDSVFSAYTYTGNGTTQTINNGIDLAGEGGMVWVKSRNAAYSASIVDTNRGATKVLVPSSTQAEYTQAQSISSFTTSGFSQGGSFNNNELDKTYASWTFRKAPKFFDVVTYAGNGVAGRQIPHNLGCEVGMIVVKCTSVANSWIVWHRSGSQGYQDGAILNTTASYTNQGFNLWGSSGSANVTSSLFSVGNSNVVNGSGLTYIAYLFAHDPSADGIVQCGSFTTTANPPYDTVVNLGWEPQFVLTKASSAADNWMIGDVSRGMDQSNFARLMPNLSNAEDNIGVVYLTTPTATGFIARGFSASRTYIYLAIRRPNKPPTLGTQVYNAIARTGTGAAATVTGVGFAPDLVMSYSRNAGNGTVSFDRLRGVSKFLETNTANDELSNSTMITSYDMDGVSYGADSTYARINFGSRMFINYFFKRAPGVFDVVCYEGTDVARIQDHGLGVAPELILVKSRSSAYAWAVYAKPIGAANYLVLNTTAAQANWSAYWNSTEPTASVFSLGGGSTNYVSVTYVAYLFATKAGISKVGSYTGNGSSQTIDCGFTTGARFVMIKATSTTGDWLVGDSTRGLVAGNDPRLSLNTNAAEVTTQDWLDPANSGFIVNQVAGSNANVNGVSYLVLALA